MQKQISKSKLRICLLLGFENVQKRVVNVLSACYQRVVSLLSKCRKASSMYRIKNLRSIRTY